MSCHSFLNLGNSHLYEGKGGEGGRGREGGQQGLPLGWRDSRKLKAQAGRGRLLLNISLVFFLNIFQGQN